MRTRLQEAEATLEAIRTGQVDALVLSGPGGERTVPIGGDGHPYSVLLNAMNDGAALLEPSGAILFANRSIGDIAGLPVETLRGSMFQSLIDSAERTRFQEFMREGEVEGLAREFRFITGSGTTRPVAVALSAVPIGSDQGGAEPDSRDRATLLIAIVTDLTYRKTVEATRNRLLERLMAAEDDERRRVARELHDETGQSLTALLIGLRAMADMALPADVIPIALRLRDIASDTVDEVGRLARGLHPAVLDDIGLAAAARRYAADHSRTFGITMEFVAGDLDTPRLAPLAAATMYRILQETLTNVARHARATKVAVDLERNESGLQLTVQDDGVGFEASRVPRDGAALGLRGMLERVTLLGGSIQIQSSPGQGTRVRAHIPASSAFPPLRGGGTRPTEHNRTELKA